MKKHEGFMNQNEINQVEWSNPQNWHGIFYGSRKDSRFSVPKRRGYGYTFNFAKRASWLVLGSLVALPAVGALVYLFLFRS
jgi:uncharacterized membrane protein